MPRRTAARRLVLRRVIEEQGIESQGEIVAVLAAEGFEVSQATVSRDLAAIGAVREGEAGRYVVGRRPSLPRDVVGMMQQFVTSITPSGNLVVVKALPGTANTVAEFLDRAEVDGLLGTVAGDDTLLAVAASVRGGRALAQRLEIFLEG